MLVFDTNLVSEIMRPRPDERVAAWVRDQPLDQIAVTTVSIMEIHYGIAVHPEARRRDLLAARFRQFLKRGFGEQVLPFDSGAAEACAEIRATRKRSGMPITTEDAMIAAIARQAGASVVTRDSNGFAGCGVPVVNPWAQDG